MVPDGYQRLDEAFRKFVQEQHGHIDEKCFPYVDSSDDFGRLIIDAEFYKESTNIELPPKKSNLELSDGRYDSWFNRPFLSASICEVDMENFLSFEGILPDCARKFRKLFEDGSYTAYFFRENQRFRLPAVDWRPSVRKYANLEQSFFSGSATIAYQIYHLYTDDFIHCNNEHAISINTVSTKNKKPSPQLKIAMDHLWNEAGKNVETLMALTVTQRLATAGGYSYSTGRRAKTELLRQNTSKCSHELS